jgi:hypothetical protein
MLPVLNTFFQTPVSGEEKETHTGAHFCSAHAEQEPRAVPLTYRAMVERLPCSFVSCRPTSKARSLGWRRPLQVVPNAEGSETVYVND